MGVFSPAYKYGVFCGVAVGLGITAWWSSRPPLYERVKVCDAYIIKHAPCVQGHAAAHISSSSLSPEDEKTDAVELQADVETKKH